MLCGVTEGELTIRLDVWQLRHDCVVLLRRLPEGDDVSERRVSKRHIHTTMIVLGRLLRCLTGSLLACSGLWGRHDVVCRLGM